MHQLVAESSTARTARSSFRIRFPDVSDELSQDEEWFEFELDGQLRQLRVHAYAELFSIPGLYEALVYEKLACRTPTRLAKLLGDVLSEWQVNASDLRVLDLGAGNGIMAHELSKLDVSHLVGLDLLREARLAAQRDRPSLYADYCVTDLCKPSASDLLRLKNHRLNCLVSVAALGFGDIPPDAFGVAFNAITAEGWLGITIKEDFLVGADDSGFARLVKALIDDGIVEIQAYQRYCHRLSISGDRLFYIAVVARKTRDIPATQLAEIGALPATATDSGQRAAIAPIAMA